MKKTQQFLVVLSSIICKILITTEIILCSPTELAKSPLIVTAPNMMPWRMRLGFDFREKSHKSEDGRC